MEATLLWARLNYQRLPLAESGEVKRGERTPYRKRSTSKLHLPGFHGSAKFAEKSFVAFNRSINLLLSRYLIFHQEILRRNMVQNCSDNRELKSFVETNEPRFPFFNVSRVDWSAMVAGKLLAKFEHPRWCTFVTYLSHNARAASRNGTG